MRFSLLAATALGTTLVGMVPGVAQEVTYDWSGFYIGASLGMANQPSDVRVDYPDSIPTSGFSFNGGDLYFGSDLLDSDLPTLFELDPTHAGLGVQAGYNFVTGNLVYGVQADIHLLSKADTVYAESPSGSSVVSVQSGLDSLATLRGRVGVSADKMLLFATAGLAAGQASLATDFSYSDFGKSASLSGSSTETLIGFAAGAGAEFALSEQISLKGEALYYDLGSSSVAAQGSGSSGQGSETAEPYAVTADHRGVIVSTGLNFRF